MIAPDIAVVERLQLALSIIAGTFDGTRALPEGVDLRQFTIATARVAEAQAAVITGKSFRPAPTVGGRHGR